MAQHAFDHDTIEQARDLLEAAGVPAGIVLPAAGQMPAPIPQELRRYAQATARAERHRVAYEAAVRARGRHLQAMLEAGVSQRDLGRLVALSRRRAMALIEQSRAGEARS